MTVASLVVALSFPSMAVAAAPGNTEAESSAGEQASEAPAEHDLSGQAKVATAAREADPSPANWLAEAEALERLGDYEGAKAALEGHRDALDPDDESGRTAAEDRIAELEEKSRGAVADEPQSQHREQLDEARAERLAALRPPPQIPVEPPPPPKREPIVKKWYFWVTLAAIVASAAAVTGLAVKAQADKKREEDELRVAPGPSIGNGGVLLRF